MAAPSVASVRVPTTNSTAPDLGSILDINRTAYDELASTYRQTAEIRQENAKEWLIQRLPQITAAQQPSALDIGCGDGTHSRVLSALGYSVTGIDFSAPMISTARELAADPTLPNRPTLLHGEFLAGRYADEVGASVQLDDTRFDLVLATAFVHLFPPEVDEHAVHKVLSHVAPGGTALISTTAAPANHQGLEAKTRADGRVAHRWRNHYTLEHFVWLVEEATRYTYGARVPVQPWVVSDLGAPGKLWIDVAVTRPA